jgi:hypothetical protein
MVTVNLSMRPEGYLCHDEKQLTAAVSRLESGQPRQIAILAGSLGSGRRHFLQTVARRLTENGKLTRIVPLSLDGFEPIGPGLPAFVDYRLAFGGQYTEAAVAAITALRERVSQEPSAAGDGRWAVCFALLLEVSAPETLAAALLATEGALTPEMVANRALQELTAGAAHVLLHIPSESTLSDSTLYWTMTQAFE